MSKMVKLQLGAIMCDRYRLEQFISCGGFGQVYLTKDMHTQNVFATKIEMLDCNFPLLLKEAECLRELDMFAKQQQCDKIPQFYGFGMTNNFRYMYLELLGKNVRELKKSMAMDRFSVATSLWVCKQMLLAAEFLHRNGWIHRDIKPANFCLSYFGPRRLVLVDFGTTEKDRPHQKMYGFCGTERYASLRTHQRLSARAVDDLWGVYYIAVENMNSELPWKNAPSRDHIASIKKAIQENLQIIHGLIPNPCFSLVSPPTSIQSFFRMLIENNGENSGFQYRALISEIERDFVALNFVENGSYLDWDVPKQVSHVNTFGTLVPASYFYPPGLPR